MSHLDDLKSWNPDQGDLPDDLALALDTDPELRAAFDARFPPADLDVEVPMPADLAERLVPRAASRRRWWPVTGLALAASALLSVGLVMATRGADLAPPLPYPTGIPGNDAEDRMNGGLNPNPARADARTDGHQAGADGTQPAAALDPATIEALQGMGYLSPRDVVASSAPSPTAGTAPDPMAWQGGVRQKGRGVEGVEGGVVGGVLRGMAGGVAGGAPPDRGIGGGVDGNRNDADLPYLRAPGVDPSGTETYTDHGRNPRVLTTRDAESTFSVDVDTGSYVIARRKLNQGYLPPQASVRVEELVNRFQYADPVPTQEPFHVITEAVISPWDAGTHLVRIGLQGRKPAVRLPSHLTFLVDTSGSMSSRDKIGLVQEGMRQLVSQLGESDTVAIVAYAGSAGLVLAPTHGTDQATILAAIDRLSAGGSTAMGAGLQLAYDLAEKTRRDGHTNRVVLLSDGDANVGETRHESLTESIRRYALNGISLTTVGVGEGNYRDTMMEQLANDGDGQYVYLDGPDEARRLFVDQLPSTMDVLARDVKVQVVWDPKAVSWYRLVGYENRDIADQDFRRDAVDAGEVGSGHHVTALYEVALVPGSPATLGSVSLRYKAPGPDAPATERAWPMTVSRTTAWAQASHDLQLAVAAATFAEKLRGSITEVDWTRVLQLARDAARPGNTDEAELVRLVERAARLAG